MHVPAENPPPARDTAVVTTIPARLPQGIHVHPKPLRSVPGIGHSHVRLRTLPPAPDAMEATASREAGGWGFGVTVVPWVVAGEPAHGRASRWAAGCPVPVHYGC